MVLRRGAMHHPSHSQPQPPPSPNCGCSDSPTLPPRLGGIYGDFVGNGQGWREQAQPWAWANQRVLDQFVVPQHKHMKRVTEDQINASDQMAREAILTAVCVSFFLRFDSDKWNLTFLRYPNQKWRLKPLLQGQGALIALIKCFSINKMFWTFELVPP